jgi:hypothetical protein
VSRAIRPALDQVLTLFDHEKCAPKSRSSQRRSIQA